MQLMTIKIWGQDGKVEANVTSQKPGFFRKKCHDLDKHYLNALTDPSTRIFTQNVLHYQFHFLASGQCIGLVYKGELLQEKHAAILFYNIEKRVANHESLIPIFTSPENFLVDEKVQKIQEDMEELKQDLCEEVEKLFLRGEMIEALVPKSHELNLAAHEFNAVAERFRIEKEGSCCVPLRLFFHHRREKHELKAMEKKHLLDTRIN